MPSYIPSKYEEKSSLESLELIVGKGIDITSPPPDIATLTAFKDAEGTTDDEFYSVDQLNDMKVGQPKKVDIHAFKLKQQQSQEFSQEQLTQNPKKNENQLVPPAPGILRSLANIVAARSITQLEPREIVDVITSHIMEALVPYLKSGDDVKIIASQIISSRLSKELSYILEAQALGSNLFGNSEDIIVPESMRRSPVKRSGSLSSDFSADSYSALEPTPITKRKSSIPIPSSIPSNDKRKVNAKALSKADVNSRRYSQQVTGKPATKPVLKSRQVSNVSLKSGAVSSPPDTTPEITLKKSSRRSSEIPSYMRPTLTSQRKVKGVDDDDIPMPSRRPSNIPNKK
ncbi:hypothetical protein HDU79_002467 [Rhizoclosmatium sp. JEL0117]|nr:hypothetical protein HDU79_002467 [Rhizoclosmatium sp. JEL0117]